MIGFSDLCLMRGSKVLCEHSSCNIYPGQKVGITGRNGCGKSSLLAAFLGELSPEGGQLTIPRGTIFAAVSQQTPAVERPAIEYVIDGDVRLRDLEARKAAAIARGDGEKIALLEDELGIAGAWEVRSRAEQLLHGLGFSEAEMLHPVASFSGGWRMRLNLAQALIVRSDVLLLDEPTNHLDLDTILFLEDYLKSAASTILCISHDRDFLDSFTTHILHFESQRILEYTGNYSDFERLRAERISAEQANRRREEATLAHMQSFVDRFRAKATKARQAQSMIKAMARLKLTAVTQVESPLTFRFPEPERTVPVLFDCEDLCVGYGDQAVLSHINLTLLAGDRVGLLGRNGAGKSTFIKTLCEVQAGLSGKLGRGKNLRIGYFAQHELEQLTPELTAIDHLKRLDPKAREQDLRSFLGTFAFSGDSALKQVATMSGGEQARLALALIAYQKPNLLLLDEPTNHLDLDTREALTLALATYPGALILVSHDRRLLETIADKLWLADNGRLEEFSGDLNDYRNHLLEQNRKFAESRRAQNPAPELTPSFKSREQKQQEARRRQALKPLRDALEKLEKQVAAAEQRLKEIDDLLADPTLYEGDHKEGLEDLLRERGELEKKHSDLENEWLERNEELETAQNAPLE